MIVTIILDIAGVSYVCRTFENESIQIDRVVAAVDDLGTQGTVTKQGFRLPLVDDLLDALGDITDPSQVAKVDLNKAIQGRILIGGFERFAGSFFVTNAVAGKNTKEVELLFQGNETNLKAVLSNITMAELCAGQLVPYNYTEIKQYFDAPNTYRDANGYVFPFVDYGIGYTANPNATAGKIISTLYEYDFKPAITFKKCFELMPLDISTTGIDSLMTQAILLHNNSSSFPITDTSPLDNTGFMESNTVFLLSPNPTTPAIVPFQVENNYRYDNIDLANNKYVIPENGNYTFRIEGSISIANTSASPDSRIVIINIHHGSSVFNLIYESPIIAGNTTQVITYTKEAIINNMASADDVTLRLTYTGASSDPNERLEVVSGFKFSLTQSTNVVSSNSNIDIAANCPELTAWGIFRTIVLQCKGQIITNQDGTYNITPWTDWIEAGTEQIILDNIIEKEIDVQVKPFSVDGAKSIRLDYKEGEDFYSKEFLETTNQPFGQKLIRNTGTEFAKNEISIDVPLAVAPSIPIDFSQAVIPKLFDSSNKTVKGNGVILKTTSAIMQIPFVLGSVFNTNTTSYLTMPFIGNWDSLEGGFNTEDNNFGQSLSFFASQNYPNNNLYYRYWKKYIQETYSEASREVKINIKLSVNDIDGWQFNEKFYYKNTLLRLISLSGISLTSNDSYVSATFMKRFTVFNVDIAPFYPSNVVNSIVQWKDSLTNLALSPTDGSSADQTDLENSAIAYGFFYDSVKDVATQQGQILIT